MRHPGLVIPASRHPDSTVEGQRTSWSWDAAPPSWVTGHRRVLLSWNWGRRWAKCALQIMGCVLPLCGHCPGWVLSATGSEGHAVGSKGVHLSYRVFARSKPQKAARYTCKSRDF